MAKKEIALLKKQIDKLETKDFDLEAWKKYTIILLARIFGDKTEKIRQIESIEYDFSSWALRDTTGASSYLETCKKLGQKILEASIDELEHFGLPEISDKENAIYTLIINSLEDELKGIQVKEIKSILMAAEKKETMLEDIKEKLKSYGPNVAATVLSSIMTDTLFVRELSK